MFDYVIEATCPRCGRTVGIDVRKRGDFAYDMGSWTNHPTRWWKWRSTCWQSRRAVVIREGKPFSGPGIS